MKTILKNFFLLFICISIVGCIGTANRFWNRPAQMSPAEDKAFEDCFQKLQKIKPSPDHENLATEASRIRRAESMNWISQCMRNKGFGE